MASPGSPDSKGVKQSHVDEKKRPPAAAATGRGDGAAAPAGMTRLPEAEVTEILSRDPRSIEPYKVDALLRMVQDVRPRPKAPEAALHALANAQNGHTREKFVAFQTWVRGEFEEKGYVEVSDEFIRDREEGQKGEGVIQIEPYLPEKYFTTVSSEEDGANEKVVFRFPKKKKKKQDVSDSEEWSEDEDEDEDDESDEDEESDDYEDEEDSESDEDDE